MCEHICLCKQPCKRWACMCARESSVHGQGKTRSNHPRTRQTHPQPLLTATAAFWVEEPSPFKVPSAHPNWQGGGRKCRITDTHHLFLATADEDSACFKRTAPYLPATWEGLSWRTRVLCTQGNPDCGLGRAQPALFPETLATTAQETIQQTCF